MTAERTQTFPGIESLNRLYNTYVIGNGDVATALREAQKNGISLGRNKIFVAAGVSNPNLTFKDNEDQFRRERMMLEKLLNKPYTNDFQVVYFGSRSVESPNPRDYALHKLKMEEIVKQFPHYLIARLGVISWSQNNEYTTIGFLKKCVRDGQPFSIRDVKRNVLDKPTFLGQLNTHLDRDREIVTMVGEDMTEQEIFDRYVRDHSKNSE